MHARNLPGMVPTGSLLIYDADPAVAGKAAAEVDGSVRPTAEAVLADTDALVVATSATDRLPLLDTAMARGIPVFCEKPLAAGLPEARHIAATARRLSARVLVGFQRRFDPEYLMLHRLVASGAAGQVLMIRGTAFDRTLPSEGYSSTAGDPFTDCLIHDIDATR
ncbi:Gfo/Idh/MocA family oxidoreductase [Streptomyces sp. SID4950]|nr:Gfo/Idh/MocA family oxidoreductase [Streptomyces sp. SID4950]